MKCLGAISMAVLAGVICSPAFAADQDGVPWFPGHGYVGPPLDDLDVVWDSPSADSSGSMPLGNGYVGLNVWVEKNGDLLFYISKTDAWSETGRLLKLGRVRVHIEPCPVEEGQPFSQGTFLMCGNMFVRYGKEPDATTLSVNVDAYNPAIRIGVHNLERELDLTVSLELWRTQERELVGNERFSAYGLAESPEPIVVTPDTVCPPAKDHLIWYHRNRTSIWADTLELQGMEGWIPQAKDPLLNRTFGGTISGSGLLRIADTTLKSSRPSKNFYVKVYVLTKQTDTPDDWLKELDTLASNLDAMDWDAATVKHVAWWSEFWNRSWIRIAGEPGETISRGYALQRYITACAGRGAYPIKFNGSIFTVDSREPDRHYDADYRNWGGPYWFQNTRLVYWPLLGTGDFEMMTPLYQMFLDALPFAEVRTKVYFNHAGAFFPETQYFWGAYANDNYGWKRDGKPVSYVENTYIRWYWSGGLELLAIMLDSFDYQQGHAFAKEKLFPLAQSILKFYDQHYPRDAAGKLLFKPAASLETWQNVVNPLPEIAGLQFVLDGLLGLPEALTTQDQRAFWTRLRDALPPLPKRDADGQPVLAAAQEILEDAKNSENPELYAVFPYRLFGVGRPDLDMARRTFAARRVKDNHGWRQDEIQAALLGLADEAAKGLAGRFAEKNPGSRFPAFWGPNFDWIPDQDHGCSGMIALQYMLLQPQGRQIHLFPAWPKAWDVNFKLHAPFNTTVEAEYRAGKVERLVVTPESRTNDVVMHEPQ